MHFCVCKVNQFTLNIFIKKFMSFLEAFLPQHSKKQQKHQKQLHDNSFEQQQINKVLSNLGQRKKKQKQSSQQFGNTQKKKIIEKFDFNDKKSLQLASLFQKRVEQLGFKLEGEKFANEYLSNTLQKQKQTNLQANMLFNPMSPIMHASQFQSVFIDQQKQLIFNSIGQKIPFMRIQLEQIRMIVCRQKSQYQDLIIQIKCKILSYVKMMISKISNNIHKQKEELLQLYQKQNQKKRYELQRKIQQLEQENFNMSSKIKFLEFQGNQYKDKYDNLNKIAEFKNNGNYLQLKSDLQNKNQELTQCQQRLNLMTSKYNSLNAQNKIIIQSKNQLLKLFDKKKLEINDLFAIKKSSEQKINAGQKNFWSMKQSLKSKQQQIEQLNDTINELRRHHENQLQKIKSENKIKNLIQNQQKQQNIFIRDKDKSKFEKQICNCSKNQSIMKAQMQKLEQITKLQAQKLKKLYSQKENYLKLIEQYEDKKINTYVDSLIQNQINRNQYLQQQIKKQRAKTTNLLEKNKQYSRLLCKSEQTNSAIKNDYIKLQYQHRQCYQVINALEIQKNQLQEHIKNQSKDVNQKIEIVKEQQKSANKRKQRQYLQIIQHLSKQVQQLTLKYAQYDTNEDKYTQKYKLLNCDKYLTSQILYASDEEDNIDSIKSLQTPYLRGSFKQPTRQKSNIRRKDTLNPKRSSEFEQIQIRQNFICSLDSIEKKQQLLIHKENQIQLDKWQNLTLKQPLLFEKLTKENENVKKIKQNKTSDYQSIQQKLDKKTSDKQQILTYNPQQRQQYHQKNNVLSKLNYLLSHRKNTIEDYHQMRTHLSNIPQKQIYLGQYNSLSTFQKNDYLIKSPTQKNRLTKNKNKKQKQSTKIQEKLERLKFNIQNQINKIS